MARQKTATWVPSAPQKLLAEKLTDIEETRTIKEILEELKIASSTYYNWKQDPNFANYLASLSNKAFKSAEIDVNRSFLQQAKSGSFQHQKLYYEMVDRYQVKVQLNVLNDDIKKMSNEELAAIVNAPDDDEEE